VADEPIKRVPIKNLVSEEGAHESVNSPDMEPYLDFVIASIQGTDVQPHLEALSKLPLEKRYV